MASTYFVIYINRPVLLLEPLRPDRFLIMSSFYQRGTYTFELAEKKVYTFAQLYSVLSDQYVCFYVWHILAHNNSHILYYTILL